MSTALADLPMPKTPDEVVIDHADGLHEGIADGGPDEREAASTQILAQPIRVSRTCRHLRPCAPMVLAWLPIDEAPHIGIEAAECCLHGEECPSIANGGIDFQSVAHDAGICEECIDVALL